MKTFPLKLPWVVATQISFSFTPIPGEMIQFDEHIFQMGWFNHQLLTQPMAKLYCKLFGITRLVGKLNFKLLSQGPLAE